MNPPTATLGKLIDETMDEMITVGTPYNAALVADIKAKFYPEERRWMPEHKIWAIADYRKAELLALLRSHNYLVQENDKVIVLESRTSYPTAQAKAQAEQSRARAKAAKAASRARALAEQSGRRPEQAELFPSYPHQKAKLP
jgi:hypothetical protein